MVLWYVFQNMDKTKLHNELRKKLDDELKCLRFDHSEPCYDELEKCLSDGVNKSEMKCAEITKKNVDVPVSTTTWQITKVVLWLLRPPAPRGHCLPLCLFFFAFLL